MNNSYWIVGTIVLVAILGFIFIGKKTEAPLNNTEAGKETGGIAGNPNFSDGKYILDTENSKLLWEGEYLTGLKENGTVMLKSGEFEVVNGMITNGEFRVDMNTIESVPHKDKLVAHLKNDDFFSVETYPESVFVFKQMIPASEQGALEGRFVIAGDLTVKGKTVPISFGATLSGSENNMSATANFAINRADWEIKYNSSTFFSDLGDKIIRDAVSIGLDLKAQKVIQ